jgi:penicillin-binding protein 1A
MRHVKSLLITLTVVLVLGIGAAFVVYQHYAADLPDFQKLADYQPETMTRVHAGDGRLLAEYATEKRIFVPIKAMPPRLIEAVLAAEDREYYKHGGVNPVAIARAMVQDVLRIGSGKRGVGASTITQQVAKNFLLGNEYSIARKVKEAILAVRMEEALSKDRILELYMNENYFGQSAYGIAAASLNYFNKSLDELSTAEAAFLAGVLKGPGNYDPIRHYEAAKGRRDYVIDGMAKIGAITEAEAKAAEAEPIVLKHRDETEIFTAPYFTEEVRRELVQRFGEDAVYKTGLSVRTTLAPFLQTVADKAMHDGLMAYDRRHGWRGPVHHIDLVTDGSGWQRALLTVPVPAGAGHWKLAIVRTLQPDGAEIGLADGGTGVLPMSEMSWARPTLDDQRVGATPKTPDQVVKRGDVVLVEPITAAEKKGPQYTLRQIPNVSGALVALDPHTGRVLAINGGWSYEMSQFNRATQARRQIGSTFKPFAYLAALENGMTPSTLILADPVAIYQGPDLPMWQPRNFEGENGSGPKTLRFAIEKSVNTMTVRMAATIGIDKIAPYIERLGIMDQMPRLPAMVLGAGETTPLRLTAAYGMLVNGGKKITPSLIDRVQDRNGQTIFRHDTRECPRCGDYEWAAAGEMPQLPDEREQVLDPGTAYQMVNILEGVVQRGTAAGAVGAKLKMPLAGKTGTTNGPNDTWFVGFSPDLVVGVYVGFDQPRELGSGEQGARTAAPIFTDFMTVALKDKPPVAFRIPPGIRLARVNPTTGKLAEPGERNVIWEAFKPGAEPSDQVIDGGEGMEAVAPDDAAPALPYTATSNYGSGVLVPPGSVPPPPTDVRAPAPPPPTTPSTDTGGLY